MEKFKIAGIGEILWDVFPDGKVLGGAPANFAFHAGQIGADSFIISRIGYDSEGSEILSTLEKLDVSGILQTDPVHPTGKVTVQTDSNGSPEYVIHENAAWDFITAETETKEIIPSLDAICFGSLAQRHAVSSGAIREMISLTQKKCLKIFDINLRQDYYTSKTLSELMRLSDVLKLNQEELEIINRMFLSKADETAQLDELKKKFNLKAVILTKGEKGSRIFKDRLKDSFYTHKTVKVTDTVGAGDSFTAAAVMGFLKRFSLEKINQTASRISAYVCTQKGATPLLPDYLVRPFFI